MNPQNFFPTEIELCHLIWGTHAIPLDKPLLPSIPKNVMEGENQTIERICVCKTLDDCLTGIGPSHIGINYLLDLIDKGNPGSHEALFPFTAVKFMVERPNPALMLPGKVAQYVPDAFMSQEYWITEPTYPCEVTHLWLVNGRIVDDDLLYQSVKCKYYRIEDSVWSGSPDQPSPEFVEKILATAKEHLAMHKNLGTSG